MSKISGPESARKLYAEDVTALAKWRADTFRLGYPIFPEGALRDRLRKAGLIERWNPTLRATGPRKPWRLTEEGRRLLGEIA